MAISDDPSLYGSNFERMEGDRYWTEPWLTRALLESVDVPSLVWEPAAGRGDISRVLEDFGHDVIATDIDMSECVTPGHELDFLKTVTLPKMGEVKVNGIVTNPPYNVPQGVAVKFVEHATFLLSDNPELIFVAMLLRSEFCNAKTRRHLFGECGHYWGEIVLTKRPRWDWWFRDAPLASPRHNFSWFIWQRNCVGPARQIFHYKDD